MKIIEVNQQFQSQWIEMRQQLFSDLDQKFHTKEIEWMLSSDKFNCYLLEATNGDLVGFIELSLRNIVDGCIGNSPVGYIEAIYLQPEFRGKGYGKQLIDRAIAWFKTKGCTEIATDTEIDNQKAQEFYQKLGFQRMWQVVQFQKSIDS